MLIKDDVPAELAMIEDGHTVGKDQQAWWQIRRWIEARMKEWGWHRQRLAASAHVPIKHVNLLLGGDGTQWPKAKFAHQLVEAFPERAPPHVLEALRFLKGEVSELVSTQVVEADLDQAHVIAPMSLRIDSLHGLGTWFYAAVYRSGLSNQSFADELGIRLPKLKRLMRGDIAWREFPEIETIEEAARLAKATPPKIDLWDVLPVTGEACAPRNVVEEIEAWARRLAILAYPGENAERNAAIFVARFASTASADATLQAIATPLGVTRERVRQIVDKMLRFSDRLPPRTDRLDDLLSTLSKLLPVSESAADHAMAHLLGDGMGTAAALRYGADVLGKDIGFSWLERRDAERALTRSADPDWWAAARRLSRRMVRIKGAAHMPTIYVQTLRETGRTPGLQEFVDAMMSSDGFEWLDAPNWFWNGPTDSYNAAIAGATRMLAATHGRMDVELINAGLIKTKYRPNPSDPLVCIALPTPVLHVLLDRSERFECIQKDDFQLKQGFEAEAEADEDPESDSASDIDVITTEIQSRGGLVAKIELSEALVATGRVGQVSLAMLLANSPLIESLERGVYRIRGWPIDPDRLAEAKRLMGGEKRVSRTIVFDRETGALSWRVPVTEGTLTRGVLYVPAGATEHVTPGQYSLSTGEPVNVIDDRIAGLTKPLRTLDISPGDTLQLWVAPRERRVVLTVDRSEGLLGDA